MIKIYILFIFYLFVSYLGFSQSNEELAHQKLEKAHLLIEKKEYIIAQQLIMEALELSPKENLKYGYELAWNFYLMKEYKKTIDILLPLCEKESCPSDVYQLLGNSYDEIGDEIQAIITYNKGLEKYPNAGRIFLERGNMGYKKKDFLSALYYYEKGIEKDPSFPSNYYRAALIFLSSSEEIWGLMYGEIFMNLERGSVRGKEFSKQLFETYLNEITFYNNGVNISLNDQTIIYSDSKERSNLFPELFISSLQKACEKEKRISIESLISIRRKAIEHFYQTNPNAQNVLFDFLYNLIKLGYFTPYNYWLFGYGDINEATRWITNNKQLWDEFIKWFDDNPFPINKDNVFTRYSVE